MPASRLIQGRAWKRLLRPGSAVLVLLGTVIGCQQPAAELANRPLLVLAASSQRTVLPSIVTLFTAATGTPVDVSYGSTAALAAQVENGAPADLLLAADPAIVERLVEGGYVRASDVAIFAVGRLVVVWGEGKAPLARLEDLSAERYTVIAIANPEVAPYGRASVEVLEAAGIRSRVEERLVWTESASQAMQLVLSGNADAAFTAAGLLRGLDLLPAHLPIDPSLHSPITHSVALLSDSRHPRAREFQRIVTGSEAREVLERHGFGMGGD